MIRENVARLCLQACLRLPRITAMSSDNGKQDHGDAWEVFRLDELLPKARADEPRFVEFLRRPGLSAAVYRLPAGSRDMQAPHLEDEIYLVIEGRARLRIGNEDKEVGPGAILYVRATEEHSFFDITEDLELLAFFGRADLSTG